MDLHWHSYSCYLAFCIFPLIFGQHMEMTLKSLCMEGILAISLSYSDLDFVWTFN